MVKVRARVWCWAQEARQAVGASAWKAGRGALRDLQAPVWAAPEKMADTAPWRGRPGAPDGDVSSERCFGRLRGDGKWLV